jgi:large subunit ribosomal protein L25
MDITLNAKIRDMNQKAHKLVKSGWVPGCVYGRGMETVNIQISNKELASCLKSHAKKVTLEVAGHGKYLVGFEEVQFGALGSAPQHISFHALNKNEKATLEVEINFTGTSAGEKSGGTVYHSLHTVTVKGYPQNLPDSVTVDVTNLEIGDVLHVSDIAKYYKNFEFLAEDMDKVVAKCAHAKVVYIEEVREAVASATTETVAPVTAPAAETYKKAA